MSKQSTSAKIRALAARRAQLRKELQAVAAMATSVENGFEELADKAMHVAADIRTARVVMDQRKADLDSRCAEWDV